MSAETLQLSNEWAKSFLRHTFHLIKKYNTKAAHAAKLKSTLKEQLMLLENKYQQLRKETGYHNSRQLWAIRSKINLLKAKLH